MEKMPLFERPEPRVVGNVSPERKREVINDVLDEFGEKHLNDLPEDKLKKLFEGERSKRPEEVAGIKAANDITNELLKKYDITPFDVPEKNIHFVSPEVYEEAFGRRATFSGRFSPIGQAIFINTEVADEHDGVTVQSTLLHEIAHFKGHESLEAREKGYKLYRHGVSAFGRNSGGLGRAKSFPGLHESIVAEIEKKYFNEMLARNPQLQNESRRLSSPEVVRQKEEIAKKIRGDIEDIQWISSDGKKWAGPGYEAQRAVLYYIADVLVADGRAASRDEAVELFFKAHFTGRIVGIGRVIEESFGKGAFRVLGMMDPNKNSAVRMLDYLARQRRLGNSSKRDKGNSIDDVILK